MVFNAASNESYDVVVIGGGPAGATLSTFLQRRGHRCLVLEGSSFPRYHIGESLIPHTFGTLDRLGLLEKLKGSHFPEKFSVRFVSESGSESDPFYFTETLTGDRARTWQVERSEFDELCLATARESHVDVRMDTKVERVLFDGSRAVGVRTHPHGGASYDVRARVVVDASGRATVIGSQLGLKRPVAGLKKASLWGYYAGAKRNSGVDAGETTIFMRPQREWFWFIPLPDDIVSVGLVGAPESLFGESSPIETTFLREVDQCGPLSDRVDGAERRGPVRGIRELAYRNTRVCGDGWLMVGDAAAFLDPIYSSGLFLAMASAEMAAESVHDALDADDVSSARLGTFAPPLSAGIEVIRRLIHGFYDPSFSFRAFSERFPDQRTALIGCLVGDVVNRDMTAFLDALSQMTPPPPPFDAPVA